MVDDLRHVPGVQAAAALGGGLPLSGGMTRTALTVSGQPSPSDRQGVDLHQITSDYFKVMRIPLLRGRAFADADSATSQKAIILNDVSERLYFAGENAVGQLVTLQGDERVVVGIVKGVRLGGPETDVRQEAYVPVAQSALWSCDFVIRASGPPLDLLPAVKRAIRAVSSNQVVSAPRTLEDYFEVIVAQRRFNMQLLGLFALVGTVIAGVGIYGVVAFIVAQRTHEIGVRMACGARPSQILWNVLGRAAAYVGAGVVAGLAGAWGLERSIKAFLFQAQPNDLRVYVFVSLVLAAVGILAAFVPARRASRVDPLAALRTE
jgi:putative ABC transport system permease protein